MVEENYIISVEEGSMKVDCHIHSLYSDGVYTVKEIIEMLVQREIQVFSLTDHDTLGGIKEGRDLSKNLIKFVSGVEFTCQEMKMVQTGKNFSIHLLGYNFDEDNLQLLRALERRAEKVIHTYENLCRELTSLGYAVTRVEIPISCGNVLQLCDVASYIQKKYPNVQKKILEVIESYAGKLNKVNITAKEAIKLIHNAGGKAIWAHPFCVYKDFKKRSIDKKEVVETLDALLKIGVDGLEAHYLAFSVEQRKWLQILTENRNIIYTVGSDFHGSIGRDYMGIEI